MSKNVRVVLSREVFEWPEFKALADRLGIPNDAKLINLQIGYAAVVDHQFLSSLKSESADD